MFRFKSRYGLSFKRMYGKEQSADETATRTHLTRNKELIDTVQSY